MCDWYLCCFVSWYRSFPFDTEFIIINEESPKATQTLQHTQPSQSPENTPITQTDSPYDFYATHGAWSSRFVNLSRIYLSLDGSRILILKIGFTCKCLDLKFIKNKNKN